MTAPAAISGEFVTIKHVPSRKVYQLVVEVAEEAAQQAFDVLGMPNLGSHVALARLNVSPDPLAKPEASKERRPFSELPYAQQAAMRCQEPEFWRFLSQQPGQAPFAVDGMDGAADAVRRLCGVKSRSHIREGNVSGKFWSDLDAEYFSWLRGRR